MYSCEFCEISKNTFSTEHLRTTASEKLQSLRSSAQVFSPVKFAKFLKTPFLTEHLQWLLLTVSGFQSATLLKRGSVKDVFL